MSTFTLAISCLTTSNLPWFMDLTFQVPMQYCSLQHWTLLLSPVASTTETRDLLKKIRDTKGTFHTKMGLIKDRNGMDLTEAEDVKKTWQEYTEELYKKDLHDPGNHNGVITHLEPDILEYEVKWALESITTKLVDVMEFQLSYFSSWKMMLWKCCTQYASQFGKLSSGHRTGKGQFSFQSPRHTSLGSIKSHSHFITTKFFSYILKYWEAGRCGFLIF